MPLKPDHSQKVISANIGELHHGKTYASTRRKFGKGRANKQAVAIALSNARRHESTTTVPVRATEQDEMYHGELTGQKTWRVEVVWPSQDPLALATMSVLGRGNTAAEAVADWTRRAQADGHDVTGQLEAKTEAEDDFDEDADINAWHIAEDFLSLCAEHGLDPKSSEAGRIHDEVKELLLQGTTAAKLATRYRLPVAEVQEVLTHHNYGSGDAVTEADTMLPDPDGSTTWKDLLNLADKEALINVLHEMYWEANDYLTPDDMDEYREKLATNDVAALRAMLSGALSDGDTATDAEIHAALDTRYPGGTITSDNSDYQQWGGRVGDEMDEAAEKFIVWIREKGQWVENGDGPMGKATAERVAREVAKDFKIGTKVLPAGTEPAAQ